jgi:galactonate dehydratase
VKITQVEIFDIQLPLRRLRWNPVLLRIHTDEGISGIGELALAYGTGNLGGQGMLRNMAERFLIGADPFRIEDIVRPLREAGVDDRAIAALGGTTRLNPLLALL